MRLSLFVPVVLLGGAPIGAGAMAHADETGAQGFVPRAAGGYASPANQERLIASVEKRYNARVVRVAETTFNGRPALKLRLLSAQRVWSVVVDASTGQVLAGS